MSDASGPDGDRAQSRRYAADGTAESANAGGPASGDDSRSTADDNGSTANDSGSRATNPDTAGYDVPDPESKEFGLQGWALVLTLVVTLIVVPVSIVALPAADHVLETLPLGWRDAYLVLPLVPALFLGAIGAWTAVANRRS